MMEPVSKHHVLVLGDEDELRHKLQNLTCSSGIDPESIGSSDSVSNIYSRKPWDIYLIDAHLPDVDCQNLINKAKQCCPDAKLLVLYSGNDKDTAAQALEQGAFDVIEKPIHLKLLQHSMSRTIEFINKERTLARVTKELEESQAELEAQRDQLEYLSQRVVEANNAFSALARSIDVEREEMQKRIALRVGSVLLPAVERLQRDKEFAKYSMELDLLAKTLEDITSGFATNARVASVLSSTELRIASLIKNGLSTTEIAKQLFISPNTVRTHRKNIRKKLKISTSFHLRNFLLSATEKKQKR